MSLVALKHNTDYKRHFLFGVFFLVHLLAGLYYLQGYISSGSVSFFIAVCGLPAIIVGSMSGRASYRFIIWGLAAGMASFLMPVNTMLFLALTLCGLGLIELFYGKISVLTLLIILLLSPLSYIITIFSFPIRLWLTEVAAKILSFTGASVVSSGNIIEYAGNNYTVDPACMGLKMLTTSLWLSLYMLHFTQKAQQRYIRLPAIALLLCLVFVLNAVTNLARIVLLVYFDIPPTHIMHDITGLGCFVVYTVVPLMFILRWWVGRWGSEAGPVAAIAVKRTHTLIIVPMVTLAVILLSAYNIRVFLPPATVLAQPRVAEYACDMFAADVVRLKKDKVLIYLKTIPAFYSPEHNPLMCWIGSGYEFEQLKETILGTANIYTGTLRNNNDVLYTAWWYDNGQSRTISQLDWRWRMLTRQHRYYVVNVTCNTQAELMTEVESLFDTGVLNSLLAPDAASYEAKPYR